MTPADRHRETLRIHLILTGAIVTAGFATVIGVSLFVPVMTHLGSPEMRPEDLGGVADHLLYLHSGFWPVVGVSLLSSVFSGFLLFERMKAPLVRWIRAFHSMKGGRLPAPIEIRRTDYLQAESRALNQMIEALRSRWSALHESEERLRRALGELESQIPPSQHGALDAVQKSASDLRAQLADLSSE